jgi:hypothetical protein
MLLAFKKHSARIAEYGLQISIVPLQACMRSSESDSMITLLHHNCSRGSSPLSKAMASAVAADRILSSGQ